MRIFLLFIMIGAIALGHNLRASDSSDSRLSLTSIHLGGMIANQAGSSLGLIARYTPEYFFNKESKLSKLSLGADLGFSMFNNTGSSNFLVVEYGVFGAYHFNESFEGRLILGAQSWTLGNGTGFIAGLEAFYHFNSNIVGDNFWWVDSIFITYTPVFVTPTAHEFGAGIGFRFDRPAMAVIRKAPEPTPVPVAAPTLESKPTRVAKKTIEQFVGKLEGIKFLAGKAVIAPSSYGTLDKVVATLKEHGALRIRIEGHSDNIGSKERNLEVSQLRAESVLKYLVDHGIEAGRLEAKGFGMEQSIASNNDEAGRALNRRVDFVIIDDVKNGESKAAQ